MRLKDYIAHRVKEDGIDEYNLDFRKENTRICVNYVFEYFNNYLDSIGGTEETILHNEKIDNYRIHHVKDYNAEVREWMIGLYAVYDKYIHVHLRNLINDRYFYLYDSEAEFRSLSYDVYPKAVKMFPQIEGSSEMVYRFIKEYHRIINTMNREFHIDKAIDNWINETYEQRGVNIFNFCIDYVCELYDHPDKWPRKHRQLEHKEKIINGIKLPARYHYDYKAKNNLFCLDSFYSEMPKKQFMHRKKQWLEAVLMYCWLHDVDADDPEYWDEYCERIGLEQ